MGILTQYSEDISGIDDRLVAKIGSAALTTTASDLSGAINEHESDITSINNDLGNETLPDATKTVKGNINAVNTNKVSKSGDTMSGDLTISKSSTPNLTLFDSTKTTSMTLSDGDIVLGTLGAPNLWGENNEFSSSLNATLTSLNNSLTNLGTSDSIYSATSYANNIGGSVTLSENFTDYKFLKIRVGVGSFDSWNITEFLVANTHAVFSGYYVFTTNHTSVKSVRLSTASNNLKSISIISSSEASLSIYQVVGIR